MYVLVAGGEAITGGVLSAAVPVLIGWTDQLLAAEGSASFSPLTALLQ
jgi:hypothetical protein